MWFLLEAGNAAAKAGTLGSTVEKILADLKPEAAYFFADDIWLYCGRAGDGSVYLTVCWIERCPSQS